jgi:hypothetical protein
MLATVILSEGGIYPVPPNTYLGTTVMVAAVATAEPMNFLLFIEFFDSIILVFSD